MARIVIPLLALLIATPVVSGQPHGQGWIFTTGQSAPAPAIGRVDAQGKLSTLVLQSVLGGTTQAVGGTMSAGTPVTSW